MKRIAILVLVTGSLALAGCGNNNSSTRSGYSEAPALLNPTGVGYSETPIIPTPKVCK